MALPEEAPEDMRAAAQEEISLVEGLVREASVAKGDAPSSLRRISSPSTSNDARVSTSAIAPT